MEEEGKRFHPSVVGRSTIVRQREGKRQDWFLPHTLEAGDEWAYGDVYETYEANGFTVHKPWNIDGSSMPYLEYVRNLGRRSPRLQYLADFMEATTTPLKWEFVNEPAVRFERAERTKIRMIDFQPGRETRQEVITSAKKLNDVLTNYPGGHKSPYARLFVVEDLSRTVIESLGAHFDIDPLFFREQISDYLWYNIRDRWVELPDLSLVSSQRSFFNLRFLRPWYFKTADSHAQAKLETGSFNVLRRLEDHRGNKPQIEGHEASVGLLRSKTALWVRPNKSDESGVLAIMLVDPTLRHGFPLWGGYNTFEPSPSMSEPIPPEPPRTSLFDDIIFWTSRMTDDEKYQLHDHPERLAVKMLYLVCSEWLILLRFVTARLANVEWDIENPQFLKDPHCIENALKRLHPLRRSVPKYLEMVAQTIESLEQHGFTAAAQGQGLGELHRDFGRIREQWERTETKIDQLIGVASTVVSIEENKVAFRQDKGVAKLTYMAFIFFPLTFISGIFSMNENLASLKETWYIYFPISVALTIFTSVIVLGPGWIMEKIREFRARKKKGAQNDSH